MILTSDGAKVEERQIFLLKERIEQLNDELQYRETKLKKLKINPKK